MKKFLFLFLFPVVASAVAVDFHGYLRAGLGLHRLGGPQACINNDGAWGNEFRIGNECDIYGETSFQFSENPQAKDWKAVTTFSYIGKNRTDFEVADNSDIHAWVIREAFAEGLLPGSSWQLWAGKRFFRWDQIYYLDFFPLDMTGPGTGAVTNLADGSRLRINFMQNSNSREINSTNGNVINTDIGRAAKNSLHVLVEDRPMGPGKATLWTIMASTPSPTKTDKTETYLAGTGALVAAKYNLSRQNHHYEFAYAVGGGVMSNFGSSGELVADCDKVDNPRCTVMKSQRHRAWIRALGEGERNSWESSLVYDQHDDGSSKDARTRWISLGGVNLYHLTDTRGWMTQLGLSNILKESDGLGTRNLWRVTTGPEWRWKKGFWSRPLIRAYVSYTGWNDNLKRSLTTEPFAKDDDTLHIGAQTEFWF